jgi:signal transduction histidine kinase
LVHDPGLLDDGELVHAAGGIAGAALENQQLSLALEASLHEVEESRLRIAAAADEARRRIEQDLHDGAQQSLVALRVRLELAAERLQEDPTIGADELRSLGEEVDQINDEVRALASGIYPSLLTGSGLKDALRAVAMRAPITVDVAVDGIGRYAPAIESAVYFTCLEALQNATKHANATRVDVDLADRGGRLRFSVHDDGRGFDRQARSPGAGLTSMRDRIAAIGGTLVVRSSPGEGTTIRGEVAGEPVG